PARGDGQAEPGAVREDDEDVLALPGRQPGGEAARRPATGRAARRGEPQGAHRPAQPAAAADRSARQAAQGITPARLLDAVRDALAPADVTAQEAAASRRALPCSIPAQGRSI